MNPYLFVLANTILSVTVMVTCICRQAASDKGVLIRVRLSYSILGACFGVVFLSPMWEWPGWAHLAASTGVLALLLSGSHRWKRKAPPDVRSDWVDLPKPKE